MNVDKITYKKLWKLSHSSQSVAVVSCPHILTTLLLPELVSHPAVYVAMLSRMKAVKKKKVMFLFHLPPFATNEESMRQDTSK